MTLSVANGSRTHVFCSSAPRTAYCVMSGAVLPCVLRAITDFVDVRIARFPLTIIFTQAPIATMTCVDGAIEFANGETNRETSLATSRMTLAATPSATRCG
jgi:hypothetical protein